ncbi:hypothetical protein [Pedobacter gandavensis]|nr:hypothetical protein [Pedobacter gandavensis]
MAIDKALPGASAVTKLVAKEVKNIVQSGVKTETDKGVDKIKN